MNSTDNQSGLTKISQNLFEQGFDAYAPKAITLLREKLRADRCSCFVLDNGSGDMRLILETTKAGEPFIFRGQHDSFNLKNDEDSREVSHQKKTVAINDCYVGPQHKTQRRYMRFFNIRARLICNLVRHEEGYGSILVDMNKQPRHWQQQELLLLNSFAEALGVAAEKQRANQQLQRMSEINRWLLERTESLFINGFSEQAASDVVEKLGVLLNVHCSALYICNIEGDSASLLHEWNPEDQRSQLGENYQHFSREQVPAFFVSHRLANPQIIHDIDKGTHLKDLRTFMRLNNIGSQLGVNLRYKEAVGGLLMVNMSGQERLLD